MMDTALTLREPRTTLADNPAPALIRTATPSHAPANHAVSLAALPIGAAGRIAEVALAGVLGDRLVELGFTVGAPIRLLRRAPFGGPLQVQIRDFVLSLRQTDAACIQVSPGRA